MREIRYRPRATFDLESIVVYLGEVQKSPASAQRTYQSVQEAIALLGDMPTLGKPFSDDSLDRKNYRSYLAVPTACSTPSARNPSPSGALSTPAKTSTTTPS